MFRKVQNLCKQDYFLIFVTIRLNFNNSIKSND
jgi:hypothetical protein